MCGDDDDAGELEEALYAGFLAHARALLAPYGDTDAKAAATARAYRRAERDHSVVPPPEKSESPSN